MNESDLVAKVAASTPAANNDQCTTCPTSGLPILLARYAVVPNSVNLTLPGPCKNPYLDSSDAKKIQIKETRYALRTLREGYVYLYLQIPETTQWRWMRYMVSPQGMLREVPIAQKGPQKPAEINCYRDGHNIKAAIIALEQPEKIGKAYIAYSEHWWNEKKLQHYAKALESEDPKAKQRFVEFYPAAWMITPNGQPGAMLHAQGHNQIAEYYEPQPLKNKFTGSFYDYHCRRGQYLNLRQHMDAMKAGRGAVIALPDPIGCVMELNTIRLRVYGDYHDYVGDPETAWKQSTAVLIEGLRNNMKEQAVSEVDTAEAKKRRPQNPRGLIRTAEIKAKIRQSKIESIIEDKFDDIEDFYDEEARQNFLKEYKQKAEETKAKLERIDSDYQAWMESESYAAVKLGDYDVDDFYDKQAYAEVTSRTLAGGALTEKSRQMWETMLARTATDKRHYALRAILLNQENWLQAFDQAAPMTVGDYFKDVGTVGKLYGIACNVGDSTEGKAALAQFGSNLNQHTAPLVTIVQGAITAVTVDIRRTVSDGLTEAGTAAQQAMIDATDKLDRLSVKLGLAYSHVALETSVVVLKIDLTVDEWRRAVLSEIQRNTRQFARKAERGFAELALAAQLRVPPGSTMANTLLPFTFWVADKGDALAKKLAQIFGSTVEIATDAAATVTKGAGRVLKAAPASVRTVQIVAHNLARSTRLLAHIPQQIAASRAITAAASLTRNTTILLKSGDVALAGVALGFQIYALRSAIDDYGKQSGWRHDDASWAIGSAAMGVTGVTMEIVGKGAMAIKGHGAKLIGISATVLIRWGGYAGAGASFVEGVQLSIRASTLGKQGDIDAKRYTASAAAMAFGAGIASIAIASGGTAFFSATFVLGPVGWLVACIGLGLFFSYMAFVTQDRPLQIWLDRSIFGHHKRSEGPFTSLPQERDAFEMLAKQLVAEVFWFDTPFNTLTDDVDITIKRPAHRNDAVLFGFVVHGPGGRRRIRPFSQSDSYSGPLPWPQALSEGPSAPALYTHPEINHIKNDDNIKVTGETKDTQIVAIHETWQVDNTLFQAAEIHIRYFPDVKNTNEYYDDMLRVED